MTKDDQVDKRVRSSAHEKEWKPTHDCRKKLHKLANKRSRRSAKKEAGDG